jgi:putative ABC transport system permease protein
MINMDVPCVVSGVVEDISKNSFFKKTDAIINFRAIKDIWGWNEVLTSYGSCSFALFFMAKPNANLPARTPDILKMFKKDFWPYKEGLRNKLTLEPLPDVYFSPIISGQNIKQNSKTKIIILSVIVLLKLVLAIINYLNLTIAQAGLRAKEVALKKLHGSSRQRLIILHVTESVLLCLSAFFIALFLSFFAEPLFNKLLDTKLNLHEQLTGLNVLLIALAVVFIGFLSGVIPALVITRLKAVDVIKGGFTFKTKTLYSKILIVFQYTVVIVLISASIVIGKQTQYMLHKNPGYNTKNIIMFENVIDPEQKAALRDEFMKVPGVKAVSYVAGTPVDGGNNYTYNVDKESYSFQVFNVDSDFFKMIGLKITPTGAAYTKDGIWINQFAVKKLGLDFLPKSLHLENHHWTVLGVVNNFNFRSLHQKIGLAMITQMKQGDYPWSILVQIESENMHETAEKLKKVYMDFTEDIPVEYEFFDSIIQSWYEKEQRTAKVIQYFAFLAIIISVMGIFAMSMFFNQQKAKEIGIRRVNGASVNQIVKMLNISFVKLVVTAFVLSVPLAYYFMDKWLQNFAYRIRLSWWIFVVSGLIALLVALITVSWQIIMTARQNPAEILKYE